MPNNLNPRRPIHVQYNSTTPAAPASNKPLITFQSDTTKDPIPVSAFVDFSVFGFGSGTTNHLTKWTTVSGVQKLVDSTVTDNGAGTVTIPSTCVIGFQALIGISSTDVGSISCVAASSMVVVSASLNAEYIGLETLAGVATALFTGVTGIGTPVEFEILVNGNQAVVWDTNSAPNSTFNGNMTIAGAHTLAIGPGTLPSSTVLFASSDTGALFDVSYANTSAGGPGVVQRKARGTHASPSDVTSGDALATFIYNAYSSGYIGGTFIELDVDTPAFTSGSRVPTKLHIRTNAANAGAMTDAIVVDSSQACYFPNISTTANAANAFLDSGNSNNLLRSTSARKYKAEIRALDIADVREQLLSLMPVSFRSLASADDPIRRYWGLVAEDVAMEFPQLVHYVDGAPDGVQYDRLTIPLILVAQDHEARIRQLEERTV